MSLIPSFSASKHNSLSTLITQAGLGTNLQLCLDAGDSVSYTSGQSWLDRSGNGYDFFRGATSSATIDDPTFNGTVGKLSSNEYWSVDGGDYFTYDSTNETWMENIHKDSALYTIALVFQLGDLSASQYLMGTANNSSGIGFALSATTAGTLTFSTVNASGGGFFTSNTSLSANTWYCYIISVDEAAGAGGSNKILNGTASTFDATYTSPSASAASGTMKICGRPAASFSMTNLGRMAQVAAWSRSLSQAEVLALYNCIKTRYSV